MPISKAQQALYPKDWKDIRARILARANNCCEECGVANYAEGARDRHGKWHNEDSIHNLNSDVGYSLFGDFPDMIRIVLTISHTDHNVANNADSNLRALCQRCHLRHDAQHHAETRAKTRADKKQAELEALPMAQLWI